MPRNNTAEERKDSKKASADKLFKLEIRCHHIDLTSSHDIIAHDWTEEEYTMFLTHWQKEFLQGFRRPFKDREGNTTVPLIETLVIHHDLDHISTENNCCIRVWVKFDGKSFLQTRKTQFEIQAPTPQIAPPTLSTWQCTIHRMASKYSVENLYKEKKLANKGVAGTGIRPPLRWSLDQNGNLTEDNVVPNDLYKALHGDDQDIVDYIDKTASQYTLSEVSKLPQVFKVREELAKLQPKVPNFPGWAIQDFIGERFRVYTQELRAFYASDDRFTMSEEELKYWYLKEHNWYQYIKFFDWCLMDLFQAGKKDRYRGCMMFGDRGMAKTVLVKSLVRFLKPFYIYCRRGLSAKAITSTPYAKFLFEDDMDYQRDFDIETEKAAWVGQEVTARFVGGQVEIPAGKPNIRCTNNPAVFFYYATSPDFMKDGVFIQWKEYLGPEGTQRPDRDPLWKIDLGAFAGVKELKKLKNMKSLQRRFDTNNLVSTGIDLTEDDAMQKYAQKKREEAELQNFRSWIEISAQGPGLEETEFVNADKLYKNIQPYLINMPYTKECYKQDVDDHNEQLVEGEEKLIYEFEGLRLEDVFGQLKPTPNLAEKRPNEHETSEFSDDEPDLRKKLKLNEEKALNAGRKLSPKEAAALIAKLHPGWKIISGIPHYVGNTKDKPPDIDLKKTSIQENFFNYMKGEEIRVKSPSLDSPSAYEKSIFGSTKGSGAKTLFEAFSSPKKGPDGRDTVRTKLFDVTRANTKDFE